MKILCPTDLSPEANNAMAYAAKLAQKSGSTLTLINVQILAELTLTEAFYGEAANVQNAQQVLYQTAADIAKTFKIQCDAVVYSSLNRLVSKIDNAAEEFDLTVMGTAGPDTFVEAIEGSKAYKLAAWSRKPVLIVPLNVGYTEISTIVFAYNFRGNGATPMRQVVSLAKATGAELLCLQVIEETWTRSVGSSRVDLQACKLEYSIVSPK